MVRRGGAPCVGIDIRLKIVVSRDLVAPFFRARRIDDTGVMPAARQNKGDVRARLRVNFVNRPPGRHVIAFRADSEDRRAHVP